MEDLHKSIKSLRIVETGTPSSVGKVSVGPFVWTTANPQILSKSFGYWGTEPHRIGRMVRCTNQVSSPVLLITVCVVHIHQSDPDAGSMSLSNLASPDAEGQITSLPTHAGLGVDRYWWLKLL